jgi:hypothetical protein
MPASIGFSHAFNLSSPHYTQSISPTPSLPVSPQKSNADWRTQSSNAGRKFRYTSAIAPSVSAGTPALNRRRKRDGMTIREQLPLPYRIALEKTSCTTARGGANCITSNPARWASNNVPAKLALLNGLNEFSIEQDEHGAPANSPGDTIAQLYLYLHVNKPKPAAGYIAADLPKSPALDSLLKHLFKTRGISTPLHDPAHSLEDPSRRRIVSELARAVLASGGDANAMQFNGFDFLAAARAGLPTATVTERFSNGLRLQYPSNPFSRPIARWAAQLILQIIHPALARTDTPDHVVFASLDYVKLSFAIDFLTAQGVDHGIFSYAELQQLADRSIAGAKLNPDIASEIQRLLAPGALWYAHGKNTLDLHRQKVDGEGVAYALHQFDLAQIHAWRGIWSELATAIDVLGKIPQTEKSIAAEALLKHGLVPSDFAWSTRDYLISSRSCGAYQTFLELYLKSHCWNELKRYTSDGRTVPNLALEVVPDRRAAERASHVNALTAILNIAISRTDAATQRKWNHGEKFTVILPRIDGWITQENGTVVQNRQGATTGAVVELFRHRQSHRFTVSVSAADLIAPARELRSGTLQEFTDDIVSNVGKYLDRGALACEKPCKQSKFTWADRLVAGRFFPVQQAFTRKNELLAEAILSGCDVNLPLPVEYAGAAIKLKQSSTPFFFDLASDDETQFENDILAAGLKLKQRDKNGLQNAAVGHDRERMIEKLLTVETSILAHSQVGAAYAMQSPGGRVDGRRSGGDKRISSAAAQTFVRMLASDPKTIRVGQALNKALALKMGNRLATHVQNRRVLIGPLPISPYSGGLFRSRSKPHPSPAIASSPMMMKGKPGWRFELPLSMTVRQFFDAELQRQGIFSIYLNEQRYDANIYTLRPTLIALNNDGEHPDAALCRDERALQKNSSKRKNCEQTAQATDGLHEGRAINHETAFIQETPIAGRNQQRPRRAVTTFFPDNQGNLADSDVVIIDQIFFRPDIRAGDNDPLRTIQYNRLPASFLEHANIPSINSLPATLPAHLVDRGPGERPSIEYVLESDMRAATSAIGVPSQIRTRIQNDFNSLLSADGSDGITQGLVEIEEDAFYRFTIPRTWNVNTEILLHRVTDPQTIQAFTEQPTVEHIVRSAHFDVDIKKEHAAVVIEVIATCDATDSLIEALDKAHRNRVDQSNPELSIALIRYVERHGEGRIDSISDDVLRDLNAAVSEIAKSTQSRENFRDLLRDSYEASRTNIRFHEMFIPPRVSRDVETNDTPEVFLATEKLLRERLALFSNCFPTLDFSGVWDAAQQFFTVGAAAAMSRTDYVQSRFHDVLNVRNVAVAEVTLATGRTLYYFSVSGKRAIPHRQDNLDYIFVEQLPAASSRSPFPHIANMDSSYKSHPREGDTERLIFHRMQIDFPDPAAITNITLTSRYDFCHSCIVCCIKAAEHYRNATINFDHFPKTVRSIPGETSTAMPN